MCKQTRPPAQQFQPHYSDRNLYPVYTFSSYPCGHCWSSAHLRDGHRQVGQLLASRCLNQMRLFSCGPFAQNNINVMDLGLFDLVLALHHVMAVVN